MVLAVAAVLKKEQSGSDFFGRGSLLLVFTLL